VAQAGPHVAASDVACPSKEVAQNPEKVFLPMASYRHGRIWEIQLVKYKQDSFSCGCDAWILSNMIVNSQTKPGLALVYSRRVTFTNETEDIKCGDDQIIIVAAGFACLSKSNPTKPVFVCNRERDFPIRPT
jgi:hypothetical protein